AKRRAVARPIPDVPPVTSAFLPSSCPIVVLLVLLGRSWGER
ncbi:MAG: hypothetical protein AVDCRST_MAG02-3162, partial [uncultured Rubrobacteraceae bacterium]